MASLAVPPDVDTAGRSAIHGYATPWLTLVMKFASQAGGGWGLWPGGVVVAVWLARAGRRRDIGLFAVAVLGANLVSESMKLFFHRPRPEPWFGKKGGLNSIRHAGKTITDKTILHKLFTDI